MSYCTSSRRKNLTDRSWSLQISDFLYLPSSAVQLPSESKIEPYISIIALPGTSLHFKLSSPAFSIRLSKYFCFFSFFFAPSFEPSGGVADVSPVVGIFGGGGTKGVFDSTSTPTGGFHNELRVRRVNSDRRVLVIVDRAGRAR